MNAMLMRTVASAGLMLAAVPSLAADSKDPQPRGTERWLYQSEVPAGILKKGERVLSGVSIQVSPDGAPTGCTVELTSGYPVLDSHICDLYLKNARYHPATGRDGRHMPGRYVSTFAWKADRKAIDAATSKAVAPAPNAGSAMWVTTDDLPPGLLRQDEAVVSTLKVIVAADGTIDRCEVPLKSRLPALDRRACELVITRGGYQPALDASGAPVAGIDWRRVRWQVPRD